MPRKTAVFCLLILSVFLLSAASLPAADNAIFSFDGFDLSDTPETVVEKAAGKPEFTVTSDIEAAKAAIKRTGAKTIDFGSPPDKFSMLPPHENDVYLGSALSDILKDYQEARYATLGGTSDKPALREVIQRLHVVDLYDGSMSDQFIQLVRFVFYARKDGTYQLMYINGGGAGSFKEKIISAYKKKYGKGKSEKHKTPGRVYEALTWENTDSIAVIRVWWEDTATDFYIVNRKIMKDFADDFVKAADIKSAQEVEDRI